MDDQTAQFLPFHAVNEFMRHDFRIDVVRSVLTEIQNLPPERRETLNHLVRRYVQVPGFRNSTKAPTGLRVKPTAEAFEKQPDLVAVILSAWSDLHAGLRQQVYDLLVNRNWEILPPEADRTQLPGFILVWPKGETFETLNQAFHESYPGSEEKADDVSLMVVWLSARLPYAEEGEADDEKDAGEDKAGQD
jgi:hypothetical protein